MGESVSRKLGEEHSSYAWIRLHPGCATRRTESDWHVMGVYCSHPACQSKPVECVGLFWNVFCGFATYVYSLAEATLL